MKKRENIVIIVVLIVMVIAIVGVSYAAFSYNREGSINSITTGAITMTINTTTITMFSRFLIIYTPYKSLNFFL